MVNDVHSDPRYEAFFPKTKAELCVPLKREGQVIGGINVESVRRGAFDETDGRIDFESEEGRGSRVTVWLPRRRA